MMAVGAINDGGGTRSIVKESNSALNPAGSLKKSVKGEITPKMALSVQAVKLMKETEKMVKDGNGWTDYHPSDETSLAVIHRKIETCKAEDFDAEEIKMDDLPVKERSLTVYKKPKSRKGKKPLKLTPKRKSPEFSARKVLWIGVILMIVIPLPQMEIDEPNMMPEL